MPCTTLAVSVTPEQEDRATKAAKAQEVQTLSGALFSFNLESCAKGSLGQGAQQVLDRWAPVHWVPVPYPSKGAYGMTELHRGGKKVLAFNGDSLSFTR